MTSEKDRPISRLMQQLGLTAVSLDDVTRTDDDAGGAAPDDPTRTDSEPSFASFFGTAVFGRSDEAPPAPRMRAVQLPLPERIDRYEIIGELGLGGMGRVLLARDPELGREVAIKHVLDPHEGERRIARFVTEARVTAQLDHPSIVPVYEVGIVDDSTVWYSMKRVVGRSLREVLTLLREGRRAGSWTRPGLLRAFVQVCDAISYAHDRGVLHRDLKPDNVMLGEYGEVYVMDWGLARLLNDDDQTPRPIDELDATSSGSLKTLAGSMVGTPGYMPPEQAVGALDQLDGRSDVWSLGTLLFEILTLERAYAPQSPVAMVFEVVSRPPPDPRERAPQLAISMEIAALCQRAMATDPNDRVPSAAALAEGVRSFLEGRQRAEEAARHLADAEASARLWRELLEQRAQLRERDAALADGFEPWTPMEQRGELLALREELARGHIAGASAFAEVVAAADRALSADPGNPDARALLAGAWWTRLERAEAAGDDADVAFCTERVRHYDDGRRAASLLGAGTITLATEPPGAEVFARRFVREGVVWRLGDAVSMGPTPLRAAPLDRGSWVLTLELPGFETTRYPVYIPRGHDWRGGAAVRLLRAGSVPTGFVYVPGGPFQLGGDPEALEARPASHPWLPGYLISRFPVTMADWCAYLNAIDREEAWKRVPRGESGVKAESGTPYWELPADGEPFVVPEVDRDGDVWDPAWPVLAISWHDAVAYAAWRTDHDGAPTSLPTEQQWEKAARGVDGRAFPWGDIFDATLATIRHSVSGRPQPARVGARPGDISVYGVRDMAGTIRELCGDSTFDGDPERRVVKGASWNHLADAARCSSRLGTSHWNVGAFSGLRVVRALPGEDH